MGTNLQRGGGARVRCSSIERKSALPAGLSSRALLGCTIGGWVGVLFGLVWFDFLVLTKKNVRDKSNPTCYWRAGLIVGTTAELNG